MNRLNRAIAALAVCGGLLVATPVLAQKKTTPPPAQPAAAAPQAQANAPAKFVPVLRGVAEIQVLPTVTKVKGNEVVTTITVKNISQQAIAGLKVEEFWWDKAGAPAAGGDTKRVAKPLNPGETYTFTLQDVKDQNMFRNTYQFSHANGTVKTKQVKKF
jgi:hypothetical protein